MPLPPYFARMPATTATAATASSAPPTATLSLSRQRSASVPSELQSALSDLLSLHSHIDSSLVRLDSCHSLAALSAASLGVKQRISQLQQRIAAVQAEVEQQQHNRTQLTDNERAQVEVEERPLTAALFLPHQSSSTSRDARTTPTPATALSSSQSADPYDSVHRLLAQHTVLAASYSNTLRQRLLTCRAQLASRTQAVRRELFSSASASSPASPSTLLPPSNTTTADRHRQFTASLHHTTTMLQSSLSMSAASLDSLSCSTDSLRSTQRHSAAHTASVKVGSKIITKQQQRQRTDRLLVWCGLAFFLLVCAYITNRRLRISRIIAFIARTLLPNMQTYTAHTATQQPQQYEQPHMWTEHGAGEVLPG